MKTEFTVKQLTEYLQKFTPDSTISLLIANPDKDVRKIYPVKEVSFIKREDPDWSIPCVVVEVGEGEPLDEVLEEEK